MELIAVKLCNYKLNISAVIATLQSYIDNFHALSNGAVLHMLLYLMTLQCFKFDCNELMQSALQYTMHNFAVLQMLMKC